MLKLCIMNIEKLVYQLVDNPEDPIVNFYLAWEYEKLEHYGGALSHYLRCAEYSVNETVENIDLVYESLIRIAICFAKLGKRYHSEEVWLQHAISLMPNRPEAYWKISVLYESEGNWQACYTMACLGLNACKYANVSLKTDIGYKGEYALVFQKALSAWWLGKAKEARKLFFGLPEWYNIQDEWYLKIIQNNMSSLGMGINIYLPNYKREKYPSLRFKFDGADLIDTTYSSGLQDLFVISILNGKRNGFYLEIGSGDPIKGNNTYLLETKFGWAGVGIEKDEKYIQPYNNTRANKVVCKDATAINYDKLLTALQLPTDIDYLQIDCEPPGVSYEVLLNIPLEKYRFAVITFEHDYYADVYKKYRALSRQYLKSYGYIPVVYDACFHSDKTFEDWWVHPDLVSPAMIAIMQSNLNEYTYVEDHLLTPFSGLVASELDESDNVIPEDKFFENNVRSWWLLKDGEFVDHQYVDPIENTLDWGDMLTRGDGFRQSVIDETFRRKVYEEFVAVEEGDVVVDFGASAGPFIASIRHKRPSKMYCVEASPDIFYKLQKNCPDAVCVQAAIYPENGRQEVKGVMTFDETYARITDTVRFKTFVERYGIKKINFLKTDCENGEYEIFNSGNIDWILKNVQKISGEFHLRDKEEKNKFHEFKNTYLKEFTNFKILTAGGKDITHEIWIPDFINMYYYFYLYIDNSDNFERPFDWGKLPREVSESIDIEFRNPDIYQEWRKIQEGDIVVDIGASVGPFTKIAAEKGASKIFTVEPSKNLMNAIRNNTISYKDKIVYVNKAISNSPNVREESVVFLDEEAYDAITFKDFIKENNIEKIDFLKIDCEGGEYSIFTEENLEFLKNNVNMIVAEFHLRYSFLDQRNKFIKVRDNILPKFSNYKIISCKYQPIQPGHNIDLTEYMQDNDFVMNYQQEFLVYIQNTIHK